MSDVNDPLAEAFGIQLKKDKEKQDLAAREAQEAAHQQMLASLTPEELRIRRLDEDTELARQTIIQSIQQNNEAITHLMNVSRESMSPRAYEVLSTMIRHNADIAEKVLKIHADKQKVANNEINLQRNQQLAANGHMNGDTHIHANNVAFIGSTTELLKMIKSEQQNIIDVDAVSEEAEQEAKKIVTNG